MPLEIGTVYSMLQGKCLSVRLFISRKTLVQIRRQNNLQFLVYRTKEIYHPRVLSERIVIVSTSTKGNVNPKEMHKLKTIMNTEINFLKVDKFD